MLEDELLINLLLAAMTLALGIALSLATTQRPNKGEGEDEK